MRKVQAAFFLAVCSGPLGAQWINIPTPGVPLGPDGRPNMSAPAPRTADGHPDFSGMWGGARPPAAVTAAATGGVTGRGGQRGQFWDIGTGMAGGLPYQPWAKELMEKRKAANSKDNPDVRCLPLGILQTHTHPFIRKYVQVPGMLISLFERDLEYRQIFTDGRPLPVDPQPSFNGYSTGRWDGDTLIVETNGLRDGLWADYNGSPLTDAARITERYRRPNFGKMEIEVTVNDPKAYTKPWTVKINLAMALNIELIEYVCAENEKDSPHMVGK